MLYICIEHSCYSVGNKVICFFIYIYYWEKLLKKAYAEIFKKTCYIHFEYHIHVYTIYTLYTLYIYIYHICFYTKYIPYIPYIYHIYIYIYIHKYIYMYIYIYIYIYICIYIFAFFILVEYFKYCAFAFNVTKTRFKYFPLFFVRNFRDFIRMMESN